MSLNFYADIALTLPITGATPKRFLFPDAGGSSTSQIWLGDPYTSLCSVLANSGSGVLSLSDTSGFLSDAAIAATSGGYATAVSGAQQFTYTGKTQSQLTGVLGITSTIHVGDIVYPYIVYKGNGTNVSVYPAGADLVNYGISIAVGTSSVLGFPGLPAIFPQTSLAIGAANAVEIFLSVQMPSGVDQVFNNFGVQSGGLYLRDINDSTPILPTEGAYGSLANMYSYRHDEWLPISIRVLPVNRRVQSDLPGFIVGQYRWRDDSTRNATALVPTNWNINPAYLGAQFIAGIGDQEDLAPVQLQQAGNSIHMDVDSGEYFTGLNRYYLPANPVLEFLQSSVAAANLDGTVTLQLSNMPLPTTPIFVGTYALDSQQFYETSEQYRYEPTLTNPDGSPRTDLPVNYFTVNRLTNQITLNTAMPNVSVYLGSVSGQPNDYFTLSVYPVDIINTIYVSQGANLPLYATNWTFNRGAGTVVVPFIAGAVVGQPVFATCSPAVAVLYDAGNSTGFQEIETVDFNPAYNGLTNGYFYLQHTRQTPILLDLTCDKPIIPLPQSQSPIAGLVAYGPVYFTNDYALLTVTAYGGSDSNPISNVELDVIVNDATFTGTIDSENPLTQTVSVVTGGDGAANLIFVPAPNYGIYLPTTNGVVGDLGGLGTTRVANDTLILPAAIPIAQLWNVQEGWLVNTYYVLDNDPLLGMIGAVPSLGEVPWVTSGTPGLLDYRTNGQRQIWTTDLTSLGPIVYPIDALDSYGNSFTSSAFNGNVVSLVYAESVPISNSLLQIGSYFLTYIQRVLIQLQMVNSNLFSNPILLQMQPPGVIDDDPWLILDNQIQGILNQFRLGFTPRQS